MKQPNPIHAKRRRQLTPLACTALAFAALLGSPGAHADDSTTTLCSGDARLKPLAGRWTLASFKAALGKLRSWDAARASVASEADISALYIEGDQLGFNYAWHEANVSPEYCVRRSGDKLWARADASSPWQGPFVLLGPMNVDEASLYLKEYFVGCFTSEKHERWCLAPDSISVDGKPLKATMQLDTSEGPNYGTGFQIEGQKPPFLVFVPRASGWAVYKDDWASDESHVPVDPAKDKPWRTLTP